MDKDSRANYFQSLLQKSEPRPAGKEGFYNSVFLPPKELSGEIFRKSTPEEHGPSLDTAYLEELHRPPKNLFHNAFDAGVSGLRANNKYFGALIQDGLGNRQIADSLIALGEQEQQKAALSLSGIQTFKDFVKEPTFGGFLTQAAVAIGQFTPSAIDSIAAAFAGGGVYALGRTVMTQAATKLGMRKVAKDLAVKKLKGAKLTTKETKFMQDYWDVMRGKVTRKARNAMGVPLKDDAGNFIYKTVFNPGVIAGAASQEYSQGTGIAYKNFADQGMRDKNARMRARGIGVGYAAIGVGGEAALFTSFARLGYTNLTAKTLKGHVAKTVFATGAMGSASEGGAETLQEALNINQRLNIDPDYTVAEAKLDILHAAFAGIVGGFALGAAGGSLASISRISREQLRKASEDSGLFDGKGEGQAKLQKEKPYSILIVDNEGNVVGGVDHDGTEAGIAAAQKGVEQALEGQGASIGTPESEYQWYDDRPGRRNKDGSFVLMTAEEAMEIEEKAQGQKEKDLEDAVKDFEDESEGREIIDVEYDTVEQDPYYSDTSETQDTSSSKESVLDKQMDLLIDTMRFKRERVTRLYKKKGELWAKEHTESYRGSANPNTKTNRAEFNKKTSEDNAIFTEADFTEWQERLEDRIAVAVEWMISKQKPSTSVQEEFERIQKEILKADRLKNIITEADIGKLKKDVYNKINGRGEGGTVEGATYFPDTDRAITEADLVALNAALKGAKPYGAKDPRTEFGQELLGQPMYSVYTDALMNRIIELKEQEENVKIEIELDLDEQSPTYGEFILYRAGLPEELTMTTVKNVIARAIDQGISTEKRKRLGGKNKIEGYDENGGSGWYLVPVKDVDGNYASTVNRTHITLAENTPNGKIPIDMTPFTLGGYRVNTLTGTLFNPEEGDKNRKLTMYGDAFLTALIEAHELGYEVEVAVHDYKYNKDGEKRIVSTDFAKITEPSLFYDVVQSDEQPAGATAATALIEEEAQAKAQAEAEKNKKFRNRIKKLVIFQGSKQEVPNWKVEAEVKRRQMVAAQKGQVLGTTLSQQMARVLYDLKKEPVDVVKLEDIIGTYDQNWKLLGRIKRINRRLDTNQKVKAYSPEKTPSVYYRETHEKRPYTRKLLEEDLKILPKLEKELAALKIDQQQKKDAWEDKIENPEDQSFMINEVKYSEPKVSKTEGYTLLDPTTGESFQDYYFAKTPIKILTKEEITGLRKEFEETGSVTRPEGTSSTTKIEDAEGYINEQEFISESGFVSVPMSARRVMTEQDRTVANLNPFVDSPESYAKSVGDQDIAFGRNTGNDLLKDLGGMGQSSSQRIQSIISDFTTFQNHQRITKQRETKRREKERKEGPKRISIEATRLRNDMNIQKLQRAAAEKVLGSTVASVELPGQSRYKAKDQAKSDKANKFIGIGARDSSTMKYLEAWGERGNTGTYSASDVVFISVNGQRKNRIKFDGQELQLALDAGSTIITDNRTDRTRSYNIGEREVAKFLENNKYKENNGNGIWKKAAPTVETISRLTVSTLRNNPDKVYLFGDNLVGRGKGGQAIIRDEPNAVGIPTKKTPSMGNNAFFTDAEYDSNIKAIDEAFAKIPEGKTIVIPEDGLGTGRAKLKETAPKTFAYLNSKIEALGSTVTPPTEAHIASSKLTSQKPAASTPINVYYGKGENKALSNLVVRPFEYEGRSYRSIEHAYQTNKNGVFDNATYVNERWKKADPKKAVSPPLRDKTKSEEVMKKAMKASFEQNPGAARLLLATGERDITHMQERGHWREAFPRLLMEVRNELRSPEAAVSQKPATKTMSPEEEYEAFAAQEGLFTQDVGKQIEQANTIFYKGAKEFFGKSPVSINPQGKPIAEEMANLARTAFKIAPTTRIVVITEKDNLNTISELTEEHKTEITKKREEWKTEGSSKLGSAHFTNGQVVIMIRAGEGKPTTQQYIKQTYVLGHEFGHILFKQEWGKIPAAQKKKLIAAFELAKKQPNAPKQWQNENGLEEWMSDRISAFLYDETLNAKDAGDTIFKKFAALLRRAFNKLHNAFKFRFGNDPLVGEETFTEWARGVVKAYRDGAQSNMENGNITASQEYQMEEMIEDTVKNMSSKDKKTYADLIATVMKVIKGNAKLTPKLLRAWLYAVPNFITSTGRGAASIDAVKKGNRSLYNIYGDKWTQAIADMLAGRSQSMDKEGVVGIVQRKKRTYSKDALIKLLGGVMETRTASLIEAENEGVSTYVLEDVPLNPTIEYMNKHSETLFIMNEEKANNLGLRLVTESKPNLMEPNKLTKIIDDYSFGNILVLPPLKYRRLEGFENAWIQHIINKRGVQYKTALAGIPVSLINRINKRGEDLNTKIPVINPIRRNTIVNRIETPFLLQVMEEPSLSTYNTTYVPNIGEGVGQLSEGAFAARYLYKYFYGRENLGNLGVRERNDFMSRYLEMVEIGEKAELREALSSLILKYNKGKEHTRIIKSPVPEISNYEFWKALKEGKKTIKRKGKTYTIQEEVGESKGFFAVPILNENGEVMQKKDGTIWMEYWETFEVNQELADKIVIDVVVDPHQSSIDTPLTDEEYRNIDQDAKDFAIGMLPHRSKIFSYIPTQELRKAKLLMDPEVTVDRYIAHTLKKTEWDKRGGWKRVAELISYIKDPAENRMVRTAVKNTLGKYDADMSSMFRKINSWGLFLNISTLLAFAVFASFPDLAGPIIRSKEWRALRVAGESLFEMARNPGEAQQIAEEIGVSVRESLDAMYIHSIDADWMLNTPRTWSDKFFKYTLTEGYTRFMRSFATSMGKKFLIHHAEQASLGNKRSIRYLAELNGLRWEQVEQWKNDDFNFTGQNGKLVGEGLGRFVEESVVRPNAAERPYWASDPRFALIWQLKAFFYAYGKNIVGGVAREAISRRNETGNNLAMLPPLMLFATTVLPLTMLGWDMREKAKYALGAVLPGREAIPSRVNNMTWGTYVFEVFDRSGVLGPWTMLTQMRQNQLWGDSPFTPLLGPTAEKFEDFIKDGSFEVIPIYSQIPKN